MGQPRTKPHYQRQFDGAVQMNNQYFVINNADSWFVNKGKAYFHGIITDPQSSPAACAQRNRNKDDRTLQ